MNTIEGNKMIAEFMGVTVSHDIRDNEFQRCGYRVLTVKANYTMQLYIKYRTTHIKPKDDVDAILKEQEKEIWDEIGEKAMYKEKWDWLIPVVQKIGSDFKKRFVYAGLKLVSGEVNLYSSISDVWDAVIEFLQWYHGVNRSASESAAPKQ